MHSSTLKPRMGRLCIVPTINRNARARVKTLESSKFLINGPKQFNCLPSHLRNMTNCGLELFKSELNRFLELLPDEPLVPGYTSRRNHASNSLINVNLSQTAHPYVGEIKSRVRDNLPKVKDSLPNFFRQIVPLNLPNFVVTICRKPSVFK